MNLKASAAGLLAGAALLAAPVAANAATSNAVGQPSPATPCATPGGFAQVASGQSIAQVQQEMGSTGNTADTTTQGGFTREEITWRNCSNAVGQAGVLTDAVTFNGTPTQAPVVSTKTQLAIGTIGGL